MNRLMAPCTPFLTEHLYQNLRRLKAPHSQDGSIHFQMMPEVNEDVIKLEIERAVGNMTNVIQLGRTIRDRKTVPEKYPLPEIVVIRPEQAELDEIRVLEGYIKEQLNVRNVSFSTDRSAYGIELRAEPEIPILGKRLGKQAKNVFAAIRQLSSKEVETLKEKGEMMVGGHKISKDEIRLRFNVADQVGKLSCGLQLKLISSK